MTEDWHAAAATAATLLQSCSTLCDPIDGSPPGSSAPGILQARILDWVAISFSNACMHACMLSLSSHVQLCATLWTEAHQAPLSTGFSRREYWSGLPFPSPKIGIVTTIILEDVIVLEISNALRKLFSKLKYLFLL